MSLAGVALAMCMHSADLKKAERADLKHVKEYVNSPMGYYSSWFSGVFYVGSDDEFDYVAIKHAKTTVKVFKMKRGELSLERRMKTNADDKKWIDITKMFPAPL